MHRIAIAALVLLTCATPAAADNDSSAPPRKNTPSRLFPPRVSFGRVYYLPTAHYSDETGFGVGGQLLYPFRLRGSGPKSRASDVRAEGRVTLKGQSQLELSTTIRWGRGRHYLKAKVRHRDTAERFFGIGPNSASSAKEVYRPRRFFGYVEVFRRLVPHLLAGVRVEAEHYRFLEIDPDAQLGAREFRDVTRKTIVGTGVALDWDTRDSPYFPTEGSHYQFFALVFDQNIGSDLNVKNYHFDLRNYFTLRWDHVLATQLFVFDVPDNPPFWRLASLGGRAHTRGYRRDRYLDHLLVAAQAEYRTPPWNRFGTSAFLGWATVAPGWATLQAKYLRPTVGVGVNLHYGPNEAVLARFDTAFGHDGIEFEFALTESF